MDLLDDAARARLRALVTKFNPTAKLVEATMGRVDPKEILGTGLFDMNAAAQHPEWLKEKMGISTRGLWTAALVDAYLDTRSIARPHEYDLRFDAASARASAPGSECVMLWGRCWQQLGYK